MQGLLIQPGKNPISITLGDYDVRGEICRLLKSNTITGQPIGFISNPEKGIVFYATNGNQIGMKPNRQEGAGMVYGDMLVLGRGYNAEIRGLTNAEIRAFVRCYALGGA